MKISVVLPAKNEQRHIKPLVERIKKLYPNFEIVIVDDGSTDKTKEIAENLSKKYKNVKLVSYTPNRGKTYACYMGAKNASGKWLIFMDADLQHDPSDIKNFTKAMKDSDIIIGERDMRKIPLVRRVSNELAAKIINFFTQRAFDDVLCGFRAVRKSEYMKLNLKKGRYELEINMILKAIINRLKIRRVRVKTYYTKRNKKIGSRMPLKSALNLIIHIIKSIWWFMCSRK